MARHAELAAQQAEGADPEDPDECCAAGIFWAPMQARWSHLKASAPQPTIGKLVDDAMAAIERDKPDPQGRAPYHLVALPLYGRGLRLSECLELRVQCYAGFAPM
jgi:hypothetical protein